MNELRTTSVTGADERLMRRGSTAESLLGLAAVILAVLGLIGVAPGFLCSIAVVCVGVAFMAGSGSMLLGDATPPAGLARERDGAPSLGMEWLASLAGVVLGVIALLGYNRPLLLGISSIVLGSALLLRSASMWRSLSGSDLLVGLTSAVLGILALAGNVPVTLSLVAMLCLGSAALFTATHLAPRLWSSWSARPARRSTTIPQA